MNLSITIILIRAIQLSAIHYWSRWSILIEEYVRERISQAIFSPPSKIFTSRTRQIKIQITSLFTHKGTVHTLLMEIMYWFWRALAANNLVLSSRCRRASPWNVEARPFLVPVIVWSILYKTCSSLYRCPKMTVASPRLQCSSLRYSFAMHSII